MNPAALRIGVIADIHCGPDRDVLPGSRCPTLLDGFRDAMHRLRATCIVDLGDRVNSVTAGQDRIRERYVRRRLEEVGVPVYHVLGNTDIERMAKDKALTAVGEGWAAEVIDLGAVRLVLLDTVDPAVEGIGGTIGSAQLDWLRVTLAAAHVPSLVFGHHPLDEPVLAGHRYFSNRPSLAAVQNRAEVRSVLEDSSSVLAAFAGHLHWTRAAQIEKVPYVTIGSLVDTAYTGGEPSGAYALVTVNPDALNVAVWGRAPAQFTFPR